MDAPDVAAIAALMGDRARAAMLLCLMTGRAHTASELAGAAGVTKPTASAHLSRLVHAGLLAVERTGRHGYFRLANPEVGEAVERLAALAARVGARQIDTGPADPAMRKARVCYDHLAGDLGVLVFERLRRLGHLRTRGAEITLTESGMMFVRRIGVDPDALRTSRRPLCLACLDWSVRRHHLAGALGAALLGRFMTLGWARPARKGRAVHFSAIGERSLLAALR